MCEPLEGKQHVYLRKVVESAVRFYKRYKDNPSLLCTERPDICKRMIIENSSGIKLPKIYNEQLFDIAFKDALEEE